MSNADQLGFHLDVTRPPWPPASRFPHNFGVETVGPRVRQDLLASKATLVVTGYAGIEHLLGFFESWSSVDGSEERRPVRLLIGVEPTRPAMRPSLQPADVDREVRDFWLPRGISLLNSRELLTTLQLLREGRIEARLSSGTRVHAKIYVGDYAVTLGSSNFTRPGLESNLEANARFERELEPERYQEAVALAENLWVEGRDYTVGFMELLEGLLRKVSWQEALARACAELLEGDWAPEHMLSPGDRPRLWPSQEQGIAQALWVLENHGAVLVADATGSGKTRMGAHLLRALQDRYWRMGRGRKRFPVLICPPAVGPLWAGELAEAPESVRVISHGSLSRKKSHRAEEVEAALRNTQLLAVDEAHNFLNRMSNRSRKLYGNVADNVVLFTATPINRGARDLLSIVELLGADNFDDEVLDVVARVGGKGGKGGGQHVLRPFEAERLRTALQEFVVRRTKSDFNELIDREPEAYVNALGEQCRYPEHHPIVFPREASDDDRGRAQAIREKAKNLRGIINFRRPLKMPLFLKWEGWTEERFLAMRIGGATALAAYQVRSRLRSSKVALVEHVLGTEAASRQFGIEGAKPSSSGNVVATLEEIAGHPPKVELDVEVPAWLRDPDAHRAAVEEEIRTYRDILEQVERMYDRRAEANADYLLNLLNGHERILAFDSHLISLYHLQRRLEAKGATVALATGEAGVRSRRELATRFALESDEAGVIGLCSDALAEGLNLQGASALVHLDLPSVIRVLEQRIGRLDRMDSPHARVEVHWPREPREFQLRADERLFWRLQEVDDLLGSNVPIPDGFETYQAEQGELVEVELLIEAVEEPDPERADATLADAFSRVRALAYGDEALIDEEVYESIRRSKAKVLSSVAVVPTSDDPWVFLAVGSADRSVPRWIMIDRVGGDATVIGSLDQVAEMIRQRVSTEPADVSFDEAAARVLGEALRVAEEHREELLPRRKRVALEELRWVITIYENEAAGEGPPERRKVTRDILEMLQRSERDYTVDVGQLADWWLEIIRPEWQVHLARRGIRRPARLKHIRMGLREDPISTARLNTVRQLSLTIEPLDRRVVAAIVGVPANGQISSAG